MGDEGETGRTGDEKDAEPRRVLVVDDDSRYRDILHLALIRRGYGVLLAHDGLTGLNLLERERVDLMIMDLMLPHSDGYDLCRRIREHSAVGVEPPLGNAAERDRRGRAAARVHKLQMLQQLDASRTDRDRSRREEKAPEPTGSP